jgi:hypothetical protein
MEEPAVIFLEADEGAHVERVHLGDGSIQTGLPPEVNVDAESAKNHTNDRPKKEETHDSDKSTFQRTESGSISVHSVQVRCTFMYA